MRTQNGLKASGRYNAGYRHWIEGCLRHGAKLYIGKPDQEALDSLDDVENYLIFTYGHVMNSRVKKNGVNLVLIILVMCLYQFPLTDMEFATTLYDERAYKAEGVG